MYAAITTRYAGPTNTRGARVITQANGLPRHAYPWDHSLDVDANHRAAAMAYAAAIGWDGTWIGGGTGTGTVWVSDAAPPASRFTIEARSE